MRCCLNLQYTYGADNPYALFFIPTDETDRVQLGSFKAEWKKERQPLDLSSLPIPQYIKIYTLKELLNLCSKKGEPLFKWAFNECKKIQKLNELGYKHRETRGYYFRKSLRFPMFTLCRDGFSFFSLAEKVQNFIQQTIQSAEEIIETDPMHGTMKDEMRLFLSVLHKDTPQSNIDFLEECLKDSDLLIQNEYWRNIAFVLGDCSCSWQNQFLEEILQRITDQDTDDTCLQILAIACWRSQDFVFQLTTEHLQSILVSLDKNLKDSIENIKDIRMPNMVLETKRSLSQERRSLSHYLELILALLRLRKEPQYRELLSPLSPQMEVITRHLHTLKKEKLAVTSRIEFDISDSKIDKEDLTLIVEMYVQGDEKTKAIKIIGITEAEE